MTETTQDSTACTNRGHVNWSLYSLEAEAELEKSDREAGHDYVPMDVFVDQQTMKEHCKCSSIRARWSRILSAAA